VKDEQIIALYWQRNEAALKATADVYGDYCFSIANNILKSREDSEECVNDTLLRTWSSIPPTQPKNLRYYLARITRNLSFDRYKSKLAQKRGNGETDTLLSELGECIGSSDSPEEACTARELETLLNDFLTGLSSRERRIFLMRYFYAFSTSDIAQRLHLRESNILVILSRTRKKLKALLEKEGYSL